jgi:hypothetical protein
MARTFTDILVELAQALVITALFFWPLFAWLA